MTLSECDGKLYVLFVQFNDIPDSVENDCMVSSSQNYPNGAANGDLYLTISSDHGATWDPARNLTNSRTPGCDSTGGPGGPCDSDHWPSMTRFGSNTDGDFSGVDIVVPAGSTDPETSYLDVQYINDHSAGSILHDEGFWSQAEIRWFRLPCVTPMSVTSFDLTPDSVSYPAWGKHGQQYDVATVIRNDGNGTLNYSILTQEVAGPSGWLTHSGFGGTVPSGLNNLVTGVIRINTGGIVNNPGTTVHLTGRLIFTSDAPTSPDTFSISFLVSDTLIMPVWDTLATSCLSLTISNTGNCGHEGIGKANLDFHADGDCDTTALVYLFDGSPVIGYNVGSDTVVSFSIYGETFTDPHGFVPLTPHTATLDSGAFEVFRSGTFVTPDSLIAVEKIWYAPAAVDSCNFVIQCLLLWLTENTPLAELRIGEAIDWDIPADTGKENGSGFDSTRSLIYQFGAEYNQDNPTECQDNDDRFGGIALLDHYVNGVRDTSPLFGAQTADNATYVDPAGGFLPAELYSRLSQSGYTLFASGHPDSQFVDLHTLISFDNDLSLAFGDTVTYYLVLATIENGTIADLQSSIDAARAWFCNHISPLPCGCCNGDGIRGNVDNVVSVGGEIDVADLTYLVSFLFQGGAPPPCVDEGYVDGITSVGGPIDVADLTFLVSFLFQGGADPASCSS
jgi:hypothetical protein